MLLAKIFFSISCTGSKKPFWQKLKKNCANQTNFYVQICVVQYFEQCPVAVPGQQRLALKNCPLAKIECEQKKVRNIVLASLLHCYFTRLNLKRISFFQFGLPAFLGIPMNHKKKRLKSWEGFLRQSNFILSDKPLDGAIWSLRYFLDKFKQSQFQQSSNEIIWLKKFQVTCRG